MQPDGSIRNRKPQARASGLPVARVVEPVKRLKYLLQRFVWNARPGIQHANDDFVAVRNRLPLQSHLHRSTFGSIPRGVPYYILQGAAEEVGIALDQKFILLVLAPSRFVAGSSASGHLATSTRILVFRVVRHLLHQL